MIYKHKPITTGGNASKEFIIIIKGLLNIKLFIAIAADNGINTIDVTRVAVNDT
jgi:hypothetical protein